MNAESKKKALEELEQLKARAKALEDIINAPEETEVYQGVHLVPKNTRVKQFYITTNMEINSAQGVDINDAVHGTAYVDLATAQKARTIMKLQQEYRKAADKDWGNERPQWGNGTGTKYAIVCVSGKPKVDSFVVTYSPYHFRTMHAAAQFLVDIGEENGRLLTMGLDS